MNGHGRIGHRECEPGIERAARSLALPAVAAMDFEPRTNDRQPVAEEPRLPAGLIEAIRRP